ncbi:MAG: NHL repeat-containing protein [Pedobacter sp.]|uniref:NHL repeat-containing protein n=1 Tax=Pedobacter sp. TaxID=1411316 RepID=UPI002809890E|nr:NHL repeat-containing protein [Pedobacter sp.]MDQ8006120.1 NHL repeat-containing protein [Pedobacter sp.]
MKKILFTPYLLTVIFTLGAIFAKAQTVSTFAGGTFGSVDGTGTSAQFRHPTGTAVDAAGNIYVAEQGNNAIRKITPAGVTSTLSTGFSAPRGIAITADGATLYVADAGGHRIRRVTVATGAQSIVAGNGVAGSTDGTGTGAQFSSPRGVAVDAAGNVYVAEEANNKIRKITPAGVVTTLAGSGTAGSADGTGTAATFNQPWGIAVKADGSEIYVADSYNHRIRKVTAAGVVTTLVTGLSTPMGIAIDGAGILYVAEATGHRIRLVTPGGTLVAYAGAGTAGATDGAAATAQFNQPVGVAVDASGNTWLADQLNHTIRKITPAVLPVTFTGLSAKIQGGVLNVDWNTLSEKDNDKFVVQGSTDGKSWTDLGTVATKATNGNSSVKIAYSFSRQWGETVLAGFGLLGLLLLPATRNRLMRLGMLIFVVSMVVACAKDTDGLQQLEGGSKAGKATYIRVAQVDKDGTISYTETVVAKK